MTRYLLLLAEPDHFARWEAADPDLRARVVADFEAFHEAVAARGSIVHGDALDRPSTARTVQPGPDGASRAVTDGPFTETVEQVGGLYVIDVPDHETAVELARLLPREYAVEVRPTVDVEL